MKAVIPCAKKKDDMFPFSETLPTAMMPVMGKPMVQHLVEELRKAGADEIYVVANHMIEEIDDQFAETRDVEVVEQEELNGTGGAIETVDIDEDFFVVNGDVTISENDLQSLADSHDSSVSDVTLLATDQSKPEKFGVLSITNDRVEKIVEKPEQPENSLVNTGIYIFTPEIFDILDGMDSEQKNLTEAVSRMVEDGGARFELVEDYWIDIGSPQKLRKADFVKRDHSIQETQISEDAEIADSAVIAGEAVVEEGAEIGPNAVIQGKTFVGEKAVIGAGSVVESSSIGSKSSLRNANVENSLVFHENVLDPFTHTERCVMGEEVDVKSGTVIRESFIGGRSFIDMNNSIRGLKFVPDARTDLSEISK